MAEGLVNAVYAMPGALEAIRDEVCALALLEHPEQHRVLLIAQSVREVCRRFGLPLPKGCDWDCVVRLLYPHGAKGDWRAEANLLAHERGLNPRYRWVREEESLPGADEEWLAQVLLAAMRGDGSALVGFVDRVVTAGRVVTA